jgi:transposase
VLLPVSGLLRRVDLVEVIGVALLARARQASLRQIAAELGVPLSTVRGWLGRFTERAVLIAGHFARLAAWLEPSVVVSEPRGSPLERAVEAIGVAAVAAARRLGAHTGPFEFASGAPGGGCCATPTRPSRRRGSPRMLAGDRRHPLAPAPKPPNGRALAQRLPGRPTSARSCHAVPVHRRPPPGGRLFRYSLIREAADPALGARERGALVRALAERDHLGPAGERVRVSRNTLDRWTAAWRQGGFEALLPDPRVGRPRVDVGALELAVKLKREQPAAPPRRSRR